MKLPRVTIVPALLAAGLLTAGCGAASSGATSAPGAESPAELLPAMRAAVESAHSVHLAGTVSTGSQTFTLNMSLVAPGDATGSVAEDGDTLTLVLVDGNAYIEITSSFLQFEKVSPPDCGSLCGKYVEIPASEASQFTGDLKMQTMFSDTFVYPSSFLHSTAKVFVPTTYHGQPALKGGENGDTLVIARSGKPYVLEASDSSGDTVVFTEWNSVPTIASPPPADVVSVADLGSL